MKSKVESKVPNNCQRGKIINIARQTVTILTFLFLTCSSMQTIGQTGSNYSKSLYEEKHNYSSENKLNLNYPRSPFILFGKKETSELRISLIKASLVGNQSCSSLDSLFLRKYNENNEIVYEAQVESRSYNNVSEIFIFRNNSIVDSIMRIVSTDFYMLNNYGVHYAVYYPNRALPFISNDFLPSKSKQKYTPQNIHTFFKPWSNAGKEAKSSQNVTTKEISTISNDLGKLVKTVNRHHGAFKDTITSQYNKKDLLVSELKNISITDTTLSDIVLGSSGQIPLSYSYFYSQSGKIEKITREVLSSYTLQIKKYPDNQKWIYTKSKWELDTISELYFYDNVTDSLIKVVKHNAYPVFLNTEYQEGGSSISTIKNKPHKLIEEFEYDNQGRIIREKKIDSRIKKDTEIEYHYSENSYKVVLYDNIAKKEGRGYAGSIQYSVIREKDRIVEYYSPNNVVITDLMPGTKTIPIKRTEYDFSYNSTPQITEHIFTYEYF